MVGEKFSEGKIPVYTLIARQFPDAIKEVARSTRAGHIKYIRTDLNWDNWRNVPNALEEFKEAAGRHLIESASHTFNEDMSEYDPKVRHLAQVAWNALAALQLELEAEENGKKIKFNEADLLELTKDIINNGND